MAGILPPGLAGYVAGQQQGNQNTASNIGALSGLYGILNQQQQMQFMNEMKPLQIAQLKANTEQQALETAIAQRYLQARGLLGGASPAADGQPSVPGAGILSGGGGGVRLPADLQAGLLTKFTKPLAEAEAKFYEPQNVRPGGTLASAAGGPMFTAPNLPQGVMPVYQNGQVVGSQPIMGVGEAGAAVKAPMAAAQSGGEAFGRAPYQTGSVNTQGTPTLMTQEQQITGATGAPMPLPYGMRPPAAPQPQPVYNPQEVSRTAAGMNPQDRAAYLSVAGAGNAPITAVSGQPGQQRGMPLQSQQAGAEETHIGTELGKQYGVNVQNAAQAAVANRYLDMMQEYAKDFTPGKLAPMQSTLTQWAQSLGIPVSAEDKKAAGSIQGLTSMAIKMAGTATRQSDAQPSQLQYFKILESMPNEQRTPEGFQRIVDYLRDTNNQAIAKAQAMQEWKNSHNGSTDGFEPQWPEQAKQLPFAWNQRAVVDQAIARSGKPMPAARGGGGAALRYNSATGRIEAAP